MLKRILISAAVGISLYAVPASARAYEEVSIVFHTITWTYEPASNTSKSVVLKQAESCMKAKPRNAAENCLRRKGWKPSRSTDLKTEHDDDWSNQK